MIISIPTRNPCLPADAVSQAGLPERLVSCLVDIMMIVRSGGEPGFKV